MLRPSIQAGRAGVLTPSKYPLQQPLKPAWN